MIRLHISSTKHGQMFLDFTSQQEVDAYITSIGNHWGKPQRWVSEDRLQIEGEDISKSIEMMVEPIYGVEVKLYKFLAEYSYESEDISVQVTTQNKVAERTKKRAFGEALIDKISTINDSKNLSVEQVDAFMTNALISNLREHLWAGNIDTFISKLQSSDVSAFFTTEEKAAVILECQTFLANLGG